MKLKDALFFQNLLHKDYHGSKIFIFDTRFQFIKHVCKTNGLIKHWKWKLGFIYETLFTVKALGTYVHDIEEVYIHTHHIKKFQKGNEEYCFAQVIFHELRHYWQDKNGRLNGYAEKDAIRFHLRMISRFHEIVNIYIDEYMNK